ncbi:MAG: phosphoglycerate kinase [Clostridia bacterium]|nr:phosphoglycerate kinase [Clostridia bacterium]
MNKKTFKDIDVSGKKVLVRVDFNVPLDEGGNVLDDTRIKAALPTINYLISKNARVILCSHLGRPEGMVNPRLSLAPVAKRLSQYLNKNVLMAEDVIGESAKELASSLKDGDVMMLENVRFHKEEEANDPRFAADLASLADIYVNDAFGTAHRAHASTAGVACNLPAVAGFLMSSEIVAMSKVIENPKVPFVVILGGAKVSDKIGVITKLLTKASTILIGGAMANTFIVCKGGDVGLSRYEKDKLDVARKILEEAEKKNVKILLPVDSVAASEFAPDASKKVCDSYKIDAGFQSLDIGPKTIKLYKKEIMKAQTIVWNGPMGVYEFPRFKKGTMKIAKYVAKSKAVSIVGGGDSVSAINESGYADKINHISTGGGATLKFLEGAVLPGVEMLLDKED